MQSHLLSAVHYRYRYFKALIFALIVLFNFGANYVLAASKTIQGLNMTTNSGLLGVENPSNAAPGETAMITSIPKTIGKVVGTGLSLIGVAFMLLIIYGGFKWMFARGNDQEVGKAKEVIIAAVIGLVIVLSAFAITIFINDALK